MRILYFDCFSGASGDMVLGALIDAGVPFEEIRRALGTLAVTPDAIWTERVTRAGIAATKFQVRGEGPPVDSADDGVPRHADHVHVHHEHGRHHHGDRHHLAGDAQPDDDVVNDAGVPHDQQVHRTLAEINCLIDGSALSTGGKDRAKALFRRLGEVEAGIHGTTLDQVHLHEVGALDSIIDIVGAVFALESLGVDRIVASPLNVGRGTIRSAHGLYPVPAPATLKLLEGAPIYAGPQRAELVTPTGALLVSAYASAYGPMPAMRVARVGYGAGWRDMPDTPNVLRVVIGEDDAHASSHQVVVVEADIDDMNPQIFGAVMEQLLAHGALDVYYTPIQMKKNRPGTLLTIIAAPESRDRLTGIVFRETTTIGIRYREMTRECLDRSYVSVETSFGPVRIKVARRDGEVLNALPEFDDCVRLAAEHGAPVKDVHAAAMKAFLDLTASH